MDVMTKEGDAVLAITPVTLPVAVAAALGGAGMVATKATTAPAPVYSVEVPVPLLPTQKGLVALKPLPQGFTRFGSTLSATPGRSENRL